MLKVTPRIEFLAAAGGRGRFAADIGTDHGYLAMHLVLTGRADCVYGIDNKPGPLSRARGNIAAEGLSDRIECLLSDGFEVLGSIPDDRFPETVFIAGIGGIATGEILARGIDIARRCSRIILQPANREEDLRRYLLESGMLIESETVITEEDRYFVVFSVAPGQTDSRPYTQKDVLFGRFIPMASDPVTEGYLARKERYLAQAVAETRGSAGADGPRAELSGRLDMVRDMRARIQLNKTE